MVETVYHIPGAPRIALCTDIHGRDPSAVLASLRRHTLDLIAIAGDVMYCRWPEGNVSPLVSQPHVLSFLSGCVAIAPTFMSLGNHEQPLDHTDIEQIAATGVTVLDNEWREMDAVVIGGLTSGYVLDYRRAVHRSPTNRYPKKESGDGLRGDHNPEIAWLDAFASVPGYHILLSHHPEYFNLIPTSIELMLSGHAHGGQWRVYRPVKRQWVGVFAPGQGLWPKWTKGVMMAGWW